MLPKERTQPKVDWYRYKDEKIEIILTNCFIKSNGVFIVYTNYAYLVYTNILISKTQKDTRTV